MRRIVIVGASLAGVTTAGALRRLGFDGEIELVGAESRLPYDRPPLSTRALRHGPDDDILLCEPDWYASNDITLRLGSAATGLDTERRVLTLSTGASLSYDRLVIATGATPRTLGHGSAAQLRTWQNCAELHDALTARGHLVVVGGGFLGLEVAATARGLGMDVSIVESRSEPLAQVFGERVGHWFAEYHAARGVRIHRGARITAIDDGGAGSIVRLRDGTVLEATVVLAGIGVVPATSWLRGTGVRLSDGVLCDSTLQTSVPHVFAAGDVARWHHVGLNRMTRVEQWSNAAEQGRYVARAMLGRNDTPFAPVPFFWSDQFDARARFIGRAHGAEYVHLTEDGESMIALFGGGGLLHGALCVNAPWSLGRYRRAITERTPWSDVVPVAATTSTPDR